MMEADETQISKLKGTFLQKPNSAAIYRSNETCKLQ